MGFCQRFLTNSKSNLVKVSLLTNVEQDDNTLVLAQETIGENYAPISERF
jgi:hypothetical protein